MFITRKGFSSEPFLWTLHTSKKVESVQVSNGIHDEIKIDESLNSSNSIEKEDWTIDTAFDAKFQNNLEAGNISGNGIKIQAIRFKRRKVGELQWQTMIDIPFNSDIENYDIADYYIKNSTSYEYTLVPLIQSFEGVGVTSKITTSYFSLFLTGRDDNKNLQNYPLRFDLKLSDVTLNEDKVIQKTLSSKFPAILCGDSKYYTGTITADLISPVTEGNSGYVDMDAENIYREQFEEFIHLGKPILIRNHSFYILGILSDIKKNPFSDECAWGIWTYNFTFTQVEDGDNLDILKANLLTYDVSTS